MNKTQQQMTPTTPASFYDFNEEVVEVPLISLMTIVSGLKLSVKFNEDFQGTVRSARKILSTPTGYPVEDILHHLSTVLEETKEYYGLD